MTENGINTSIGNAIDIEDVRCTYGTFEAVRGVSLNVRRGELFALLGANGAGKTTLIETLEGMGRPASGRVRVLGLDPVRDRRVVRARTGVMLQRGGFSGSLTVRETVEIWRLLTDRPRPADEALDMVGMRHRDSVAVDQLSGGESRRLELALAVLGRPELLFLDEPTTGMDPSSRRKTWDVVRELRAGGTTVLLTTHYLEEAEALADRLAIMKTGEIVAEGTPDQVARKLPAKITFRRPDGIADFPRLTGSTMETDDTTVTYWSTALQPDLTALLDWANGRSLTLAHLAARPASLEDVFMDVAVDHAAAANNDDDQPLEVAR